MFFLQAVQAPVVVKMGEETLVLPKFPMDQVILWAAEIVAQRAEEITNGLDEAKRREYLVYYPNIPPDINEMKRLLRTPEGVKRVLDWCLTNGKYATGSPIGEAAVAAVYGANGAGRLGNLASALADLDDRADKAPTEDTAGADPLTRQGKPGSRDSAATGAATSRSTKPSTAEPGVDARSPSSKVA